MFDGFKLADWLIFGAFTAAGVVLILALLYIEISWRLAEAAA